MKIEYENLSLSPYPGRVYVFPVLDHLKAKYCQLTGEAYTYSDEPVGGRFIQIKPVKGNSSENVYLVWARTLAGLAHEFSHVILLTFEECGIDPVCGKGEPFCYLLSQLLIDCGQSKPLRWK